MSPVPSLSPGFHRFFWEVSCQSYWLSWRYTSFFLWVLLRFSLCFWFPAVWLFFAGHVLFCIDLAWVSLSFLILCVLYSFLKILGHYFFQYCFRAIFSFYSFWDANHTYVNLLTCSMCFLQSLHSFFPSLNLSLDAAEHLDQKHLNFYWAYLLNS